MQWRSAAAFMLAFALGSSLASAGEIQPPRRGTEGIALAASRLALESGSGQTSFNFAHLRDLWIRVTLPGAATPVQLDLRLIDPQGTLIYEARVAYASDPRITTMEVPGAPHAVPVFWARTLRDGIALDYALPVSGSVVTRSLSEGTWTLVAEAGGRTFSTSLEVSTGY